MLNWGGKNWRPGAPSNRRQPINQSIEELMKPLGEKTFQGNVWGSVIMNVPETTSIPDVTPTPTPSITPTISLTPTITPTNTGTPTQTPTNTPTPSATPVLPDYAGFALVGNTAYDACNGLFFGGNYSGDSSSFCSSNTLINTDDTLTAQTLSTGVYYIFDFDGLTGVKSVNYVAGDNFFTYSGNCESCPVVRFVAYGTSDTSLINEPATYYTFDASTWQVATSSSLRESPTSSYAVEVQYNDIQDKWIIGGNQGFMEESTNGVTYSYGGPLSNSISDITQGTNTPDNYNVSMNLSFDAPVITSGYSAISVPSFNSLVSSCGSGAIPTIFCRFPIHDIWLAGPARCTGDALAYNLSTDPSVDTWSANTDLNNYLSQPKAFASNYDANTQTETLVVAVGIQSLTSSMAAVSNDGLTWTGETSSLYNSFDNLNCVIWDGTQWIAGGTTNSLIPGPLLATSTDGISWTINTGATQSSTGIDFITDISFDGTTYVAVGQNALGNVIITSTDLDTWNTATISIPPTVLLYKLDSNPHPYRR